MWHRALGKRGEEWNKCKNKTSIIHKSTHPETVLGLRSFVVCFGTRECCTSQASFFGVSGARLFILWVITGTPVCPGSQNLTGYPHARAVGWWCRRRKSWLPRASAVDSDDKVPERLLRMLRVWSKATVTIETLLAVVIEWKLACRWSFPYLRRKCEH